jgi:hypothetical protein
MSGEDKGIEITELNDELELEIEDDTPEEDRGREPMPEEIVKNLEYDELDEFSKEKAKQLKKVWHDERRAKESAARERDEAIRVARRLAEENQSLKKNLSSGEQVLMGTTKQAYEREIEIAKREFKDAYDSGDADKIAEAQEKLMGAKMKLQQAESYQPVYNFPEQSLQAPDYPLHRTQNEQEIPVPKPDAKALAWQERNSWFGENRKMTAFAYGLHEELVSEGMDPTSDDYYARIDKEIRQRFPERFKSENSERKGPATVVASARRTTGPQKVRLTQTQVSLAKRLGLTPEQYARELIKLGDLNV